jgi:hypothetical protein
MNMIVTKAASKVTGYIEYSYEPDDYQIFSGEVSQDDLDCMYESDKFNSLDELLAKLQPEVLEEIKREYDAKRVWVSNISFSAQSESGDTTSNISMFTNGSRGFMSTKIENEDIESRLMLNFHKVKEIIDNTIDQYPVKY